MLNVPKYTIIVCVGPSGAGKSTYVKKLGPEYAIVSSDEIRRKLLLKDLDEHDPYMYQVSQQAFDLLFAEVDARSSFPVNNPYIVVDTTGLQKEFRDRLKAIAEKNNYNITALVFNYKDRQDYFRFRNNSTVRRQVKKLFEEIGKLGMTKIQITKLENTNES